MSQSHRLRKLAEHVSPMIICLSAPTHGHVNDPHIDLPKYNSLQPYQNLNSIKPTKKKKKKQKKKPSPQKKLWELIYSILIRIEL